MINPEFRVVDETENPADKPQDVVLPRDGSTYVHERDGKRLHAQHNRVLAFLRDGKEHTLAEIAAYARCPEASASARLRDLRKARFGSYRIERTYVERGLWSYRLVVQPELSLQ